MRKFKTKKNNKNKDLYIFIILFIFLMFLHFYNKYISKRFIDISTSIIERNSIEYIKKSIILDKYDPTKLININKNKNDEILYMDIDYNEANDLLGSIIKRINNNKSNISNEIKMNDNNYYIELPLNIISDINGVGPLIPIKLVFFDNILCSINTIIKDYGINNAMVSVYLNVKVSEKMILPYKTKTINNEYNVLLSSKIINGKVPNFYNGSIKKSSNIIGETMLS